jgi:hypothetical protein
MDKERRSSDRVVVAAVLLTGFGAAHLIDDFLYGIPAELGLSNAAGQVLTVLYFVITSILLVLAARGSKVGYLGNLGLGIFLIVADIAKHAPEGLFAGAWRSGLLSRVLAWGVILSASGLVVVSYKAYRRHGMADCRKGV